VSRLLETARIAEANYRPRLSAPRGHRRYRVISVVSNKGGVGKTTVATNLAVYLRSLYEDLPILMLALDEQPTLDRMFAIDRSRHPEDIVTAMRNADLTGAIRLGQYGIHYVQPSAGIHELKLEINDPFHLDRMLRANDWPGLVIIDTKSDLEILTRNAILASDLSLVLVSDHASLIGPAVAGGPSDQVRTPGRPGRSGASALGDPLLWLPALRQLRLTKRQGRVAADEPREARLLDSSRRSPVGGGSPDAPPGSGSDGRAVSVDGRRRE
jgi:hypothetical protein